MPYRIEYAAQVEEHLQALTARQRRTVFEGARRHLSNDPLIETRNRKPMRPNPVAPWELRLGNLRLYNVSEGSDAVVSILAIGLKQRSLVRIGREVIDL